MSHSHAHGEAAGNYFLDQLFTILACGGIGLVAVLMYQTGMVNRILVPMFFIPVLLGGIALLAMALVRAVAVWKLAGARAALADDNGDHDHDHDHDHAHAHSHGHEHAHGEEDYGEEDYGEEAYGEEDCGHEHSHGAAVEHEHGHDHAHAHSHAHAEVGGEEHHDHGWAPWRYMVLAIPVFLYFLGLPRDGFSSKVVDRQTSHGETQDLKRQGLSMLVGGPAWTKALRRAEPQRMTLRFKELTEAAAIPSRQDIYDGNIGILRGMYKSLPSSNEFTLLRVSRTCCVADEVMLETRIISAEPIQGIEDYQWVWVEGLISFQKNEKGKWIPVLTLANNDAITPNAEATTNANIP